MVILGIDPGTTQIGWGAVEKNGSSITHRDHGCLFLKDYSDAERLVHIFDGVSNLVERYAPDHVGVERVFFSKNKKTAMAVSEARGVIITAVHKAGVATTSYTPNQIKQAVSTHGRADKKEVQKMVTLLLGLAEVPEPDDAADALAVALCAGQHLRQKRA